MTTPDPLTWGGGRDFKHLALATLLLVAGMQLLLAACAEEVNKLAPPPDEYGFGPYLETTPFLLNRLPEPGQKDPTLTTRPASRPDIPETPLSPPETAADDDLTAPAVRPREP